MNQPTQIRLYSYDDPSSPYLQHSINVNPFALPEIHPHKLDKAWWDEDSISETDLAVDLSKVLKDDDELYLWDPTSTAILSFLQHLKRNFKETKLLFKTLKIINLYNVYTAIYCFKPNLFSWPSDASGLHLSPKLGEFLSLNNIDISNNPGINLRSLLDLFTDKANDILEYHAKSCDPGSTLSKLSLVDTNSLADEPKPVACSITADTGICSIIVGYPIGLSFDGCEAFIVDINKSLLHLSNAGSDLITESVSSALSGEGHLISVYRVNVFSGPAIFPIGVINSHIAQRFSLSYERITENIHTLKTMTTFNSKLRDAALTSDIAIEPHHVVALLPEEQVVKQPKDMDLLLDRWAEILTNGKNVINPDLLEDYQHLIRSIFTVPLPNGISWEEFKRSLREIDQNNAHCLYEPYRAYLQQLS